MLGMTAENLLLKAMFLGTKLRERKQRYVSPLLATSLPVWMRLKHEALVQ